MALPPWLIYGANGYTGTLVAEEAVRRGHRPILAGRSRERLVPLAERLGLEYRLAAVDDGPGLLAALRGVELVLHIAGPFIQTADPMRRACLASRAHYLDVTGEIPVFEAGFGDDGEARARGVAIISGVGFDVVPTDCLAAYVAGKLEEPVEVELAIFAKTRPSTGTLKTELDIIARGGRSRRDGQWVDEPLGGKPRTLRFPSGERLGIRAPLAELSTVPRSTGASTVSCYMTLPPAMARLARPAAAVLGPLLRVDRVRGALQRMIDRRVPNPTQAERQVGLAEVWARAIGRGGASAEAWLLTPEPYVLTAASGVNAVERTLAERPVGALTPAQAFGADFALQVPGTRRLDALD
jgi:short subunit dehydrogenase-like uncharacterized protein